MKPIEWKTLPLEEWPAFAAELIAVGSREQRGHTLHKEGDFFFGVWEAEANTTTWLDYPCHEFMVLLEGTVAVIEEKRVTTYRAGDCFTIAHHTRCIWAQSGRVRKFFVATTEGTLRDGKSPVALIDAGDQGVSFAISKSVSLWSVGPLSVGARKLKKGEKVGVPSTHVVLHIVDASPRLEGATVFAANGDTTTVAEEDMVAIFCSYVVQKKPESKM